MIRIATDVGGTFTDLVAFDEETNRLYATKVSTSLEIIEGLACCVEKTGLPLKAVNFFLHGSTVAINTVIERKGAKTALVTTKGFEDIIEIGRGNIPNSFDLLFTTPEALVPRGLRVGINERLDYTGAIRKELDLAEAQERIGALLKQGVEAVAVCFLHAYPCKRGGYLWNQTPPSFHSMRIWISLEFAGLRVCFGLRFVPRKRRSGRGSELAFCTS